MITQSTVEHYRSIASASVEFQDINILAGKNASGKSNFVDCLRIVREFAENGIDHALGERHGIDSVKQWSPSKPYHVKLRNNYASARGVGYYEVVISSINKEFKIIEESGAWASELEINSPPVYQNLYFFRQKNSNRVQIYLSKPSNPEDETSKNYYQSLEDELFLFNKRTTPLPHLDIVEEYWNVINSFEAYNIFPNTIRQPQPPSKDRRLVPDGRNLCSVFKSLQRTAEGRRRRKQIIDLMSVVMEDLSDIEIRTIAGLLTPQFIIQHDGVKKKILNVSQVSDGTLRIFGILTAILQTQGPATIAIEEPEQTIHPGLLGIVAECIKLRAPDTQFIITSHSPEFLEHFEYSSVLAVEMRHGETSIGPISADQRRSLEENLFGVGELLALEGLRSDQ